MNPLNRRGGHSEGIGYFSDSIIARKRRPGGSGLRIRTSARELKESISYLEELLAAYRDGRYAYRKGRVIKNKAVRYFHSYRYFMLQTA